MATLVKVTFPEGTVEDYERVDGELDTESDVPEGLIFHCAFEKKDGGIGSIDVWESKADFERFQQERLMPTIESLGLGERAKSVQVDFIEVIDYQVAARQGALA